MADVKYAMLSHKMDVNGNRVSKILVVRDNEYSIFNIKCYEFEIPSRIAWKLQLGDTDTLSQLTKIKI